jgi:hypothetical protein
MSGNCGGSNSVRWSIVFEVPNGAVPCWRMPPEPARAGLGTLAVTGAAALVRTTSGSVN